ncbi:hypothetical protein IJ556_04960 [bacterium]|nr:hypothetical protein [bacterium]
MVNSVQGGDLNPPSYGSIKRKWTLPNGRISYAVTDSAGKPAGSYSVPQNQCDIFEKSYSDIVSSASEIKQYVNSHSSVESTKNRKLFSNTLLVSCSIIGGAIPLMLTKKFSIVKRIFGTAAGILTGLATGLGLSLEIITPPGTYKFMRAKHTLSSIDIQPIREDE